MHWWDLFVAKNRNLMQGLCQVVVIQTVKHPLQATGQCHHCFLIQIKQQFCLVELKQLVSKLIILYVQLCVQLFLAGGGFIFHTLAKDSGGQFISAAKEKRCRIF